MELVFSQLLPLLSALWWPFCRILAMLSATPIIGDGMVPIPVRILLSLVLAVVMLPISHSAAAIDPISMHGVLVTIEQAVIGGMLGLAFHLSMSVIMMLGFLVSSQMGLSMAVMNDPMNGNSSDVVSSMLSILCIVVFFSIDGHLVLTGVIGSSLKAWPIGGGFSLMSLQAVAYNVSWVFAAALLLAVPIAFSSIVVQIGFGFLNRVAPSLNLFSLGFAVITMFGLFMLAQIVRFVPEHYVRMTGRILDMLQQQMQGGVHG
ncbi:flagellar biosynthetic protein FliR [Undibacterium sp.]|jgi:flagellar biosynthetic protein FliR|uniref:flagellar biosynthetic protein FliR n=1 Tax=Undibacterium sp. TaxID=1914977 RepID=UPI002D0D3996|nr:flagellar biosynthetic protein FliR [Undibacterium sp.]HTD03755.1 flagellar biosynthetic protein FliR [Undibacterium sp.]